MSKRLVREKTTFVVVSKTAIFSDFKYNNCFYWSCKNVCDILHFLLYSSFIRLGNGIYIHITGIPMGGNYVPLVDDLFLFCYESEFMKNLPESNDLNLIEKFNTT